MRPDHALAEKFHIEPHDLDGVPFVNVNSDSYIGHRVESMFEAYKVKPETVLVANVAPTLCEFVAAGIGVSLVHPLVVSGMEDRLAMRRFEPEILFNFQLCRSVDSRNAQLVETFAQQVRTTASHISQSMLRDGGPDRPKGRAKVLAAS
jgi:DNA-binding transcriptional LysR family regulator